MMLTLQNICKSFPGVKALDKAGLELHRGEVLALIGENGAGKSTLMKILGGIQDADSGEILIDEKPCQFNSVKDAEAAGITLVHQELSVFDNLDVAGNILLGHEPRRGIFIDRKQMVNLSRPWMEKLGLDIEPSTVLKQLSLGQRQMVEIARALARDSRIIILDEPTSSLTLKETDALLKTISQLRHQGISFIYISHRLKEIEIIADRVTALKDGCYAGSLEKEDINYERMVELMVGRDLENVYRRNDKKIGNAVLRVEKLVSSAWPESPVSFEVRSGEILGFYGLVGAGRSEMVQALSGADPRLAGRVFVHGSEIQRNSMRQAIAHGLLLAPEDRKESGLVLDFSVAANLALPSMKACSHNNFIRTSDEAGLARRLISRLKIKCADPGTLTGTLSGGNQQKIVLAKWLELNPEVMILDEPTRGIDMGARSEIYEIMRQLTANGKAVIMISSDMEEMLGVADRIAVMHEGKISGILDKPETFTEERVIHLAVGN